MKLRTKPLLDLPESNPRRPLTVISRRAGLQFIGGSVLVSLFWMIDASSTNAQTNNKKIFDLSIENGKVAANKRTIKVTRGDQVELRMIANEAMKLHLHGYDIHLHLQPATTGIMRIEAHTAGRFPIRVHGAGGHKRRALIYLEVHPR